MLQALSPLTLLRQALAAGAATPRSVAEDVVRRANSSPSRNTYISFDADSLRRRAQALEQRRAAVSLAEFPLWSVPVSLKDCFDLAGTATSCGSRFYAQRGACAQNSAMAASLYRAGALITGKTHLHPLAYGITGENPEYGHCLQPRDATLLTGGSSSGAAASVQEGSALAAIGTDTGGSIRVPAALCGLVGFRASQRLDWPEAWQGASHLAPSFDTLGLLLRDPRDAAPIARTLFTVPDGSAPGEPRIGCVPASLLADCEPDVLVAFEAWKQQLAALGAHLGDIEFAPGQLDWSATTEVFAGIQAHEAAHIHAGHYEQFEPAIRDRLRWGASLPTLEVAALRLRQEAFLTAMRGLFLRFDMLMMPCAPVSRLLAADDHSSTRQRILRYTTPFSLAGLPSLSLPGEMVGAGLGTGVQIAAAPGADAMLLAYAAAIGERIAPKL